MSETGELIGFSVKELFIEIRNDVKSLRNHVDAQDRSRGEKLALLEREVLALRLNADNAEKLSVQVQKNSRNNTQLAVAFITTLLGNIVYIVMQWHK